MGTLSWPPSSWLGDHPAASRLTWFRLAKLRGCIFRIELFGGVRLVLRRITRASQFFGTSVPSAPWPSSCHKVSRRSGGSVAHLVPQASKSWRRAAQAFAQDRRPTSSYCTCLRRLLIISGRNVGVTGNISRRHNDRPVCQGCSEMLRKVSRIYAT